MNVIPAWQAGFSGQGVLISIIDDGLDHQHPELIDRYVSIAFSPSFSSVVSGHDVVFGVVSPFVVSSKLSSVMI